MRRQQFEQEGFEPKPPGRLMRLVRFLFVEPVLVAASLWDGLDGWRMTRPWRSILLGLPALLLLLVCGGAVAAGKLKSKSGLLDYYLKLAEEEAPLEQALAGAESGDSGQATPAAVDGEETPDIKYSEYADMLYRRVLQLENNNKRARYYVGLQMQARGASDQARPMMESLAPAGDSGYPPAHAWLATDLLIRAQNRIPIDLAALEHHLAKAANWSGVNPQLLMTYAQLLERQEKVSLAVAVAQRAAERQPRLNLALAELCRRHQREDQMKTAAERAERHFRRSFGRQDEPDDDRIGAAQALVLLGRPTEAETVLREGLALRPDRPGVRQALSNLYLLEYRRSLRPSDTGFQANLPLLNAALQADPSNPSVSEEVARLSSFGVAADERMEEALRKQLASGQATAVTHLLLADNFYARQMVDQAITHWQLALAQDPRLVLALNNLAVALTRIEPPQLEPAQELIERALQIAGPRPELLDSQGQVLLASGKLSQAVASFERALESQPDRIRTRQRLADAYLQLGLEAQAEAQLEVIQRLQAAQEEAEAARRQQQAQQEAATPAAEVPTEPEAPADPEEPAEPQDG
jgi:tetratricopeptide (TPR) repeat protein